MFQNISQIFTMATLGFTSNLKKFLQLSEMVANGVTVRAILTDACQQQPALRSYIFDDQGHLRHHIAIFVQGKLVTDREGLSDPVPPNAAVYIFQALSGG